MWISLTEQGYGPETCSGKTPGSYFSVHLLLEEIYSGLQQEATPEKRAQCEPSFESDQGNGIEARSGKMNMPPI